MEIRSKKKVQLWKKAIVHFSLCFVMGFFTGFAPTGKRTMTSSPPLLSSTTKLTTNLPRPPQYPPHPVKKDTTQNSTTTTTNNVNRTLVSKIRNLPSSAKRHGHHHHAESLPEEEEEKPRRLIILVTPTDKKGKFGNVLLRRLANTIKLVGPPLLWVVVERKSDSDEVSEMLRKTGIMYRHLVYKENFTDSKAEMDHQRNVALRHLEQHRLSGIVHFAELSNVYDLQFFDELRNVEVFGTWAMAILGANKQKVVIEGPVCDSSQVIGWHLKKINNNFNDQNQEQDHDHVTLPIHISSFAFNSSILWDPERWGRPSSGQQTSQNSIKFVKQVVLEDETKLKGIPPEDCSRIMLWSLNLPTKTPLTPLDK